MADGESAPIAAKTLFHDFDAAAAEPRRRRAIVEAMSGALRVAMSAGGVAMPVQSRSPFGPVTAAENPERATPPCETSLAETIDVTKEGDDGDGGDGPDAETEAEAGRKRT